MPSIEERMLALGFEEAAPSGMSEEEVLERFRLGDSYEDEKAVEKNLEGMKMKFDPSLGMIEGAAIELGDFGSKEEAAFFVGMGDMLGDSARGIKQMLTNAGIVNAIDTDSQDANEEIMRKLYDSSFGAPAGAGAVAGAVAEPVGLLAPALKFNSVGKALTYGAVVGGTYGTTLYVDGEESRVQNAALGALTGGTIGGLIGRYTRQAVGSKIHNAIEKELDPRPRVQYKNGKPVSKYKAKRRNNPDEVIEDIAARSATKGPRVSKLMEAKDLIDQAIMPVYDAVKKYSPKIAIGLRRVDSQQHKMSKAWTDRTTKFNKWVKTLDEDSSHLLHKALANGVTKETMQLANQLGGKEAVQSIREVQGVLKEILGEYKKAGYRVKPRSNYFPTSVKNLDELVKIEQTSIDRAIVAATQKKGSPLTKTQQAKVVEGVITRNPLFSSTSGSLKKRKVQDVQEEALQHYNDPVTALHYYVASAAEDIAKRNFFKHFGHKPKGNDGLDVTGADILDSIDSVLNTMKKDVPDIKDQRKLIELMKSRFSEDVHRTHGYIQALKNASYAGTLGNYWSAMTQIGDAVFAVHKYGIRDAVTAMVGKNITNKERLGIDKAMLELNSERMLTSTIADWAFKWGGFDAVDRWGKNVNINASLRHNRRLAIKNPDKFMKKYKTMFGEETEGLMRELQHLDMTKKKDVLSDNMHLMLWNDLADTQPIGLSEMPKKYLDMPNMRVVYAYKTFTIKQFNYMRNILKGDSGKVSLKNIPNLAKFATMFVLANSTIDSFKDFMSGKDLDYEDNLIDNAWGLLGTSKYVVEKGQGAGSIVEAMINPVPVMQGYDVGNAVTKAAQGKYDPMEALGKVVNQLPIIGKINREYEFIE